MPAYVLLTRLNSEPATPGADHPGGVWDHLRTVMPEVRWTTRQPTGARGYLDRFEAPSEDEAVKVSMITRTHARAHTELWTAPEWEYFQQLA